MGSPVGTLGRPFQGDPQEKSLRGPLRVLLGTLLRILGRLFQKEPPKGAALGRPGVTLGSSVGFVVVLVPLGKPNSMSTV